MNLKIAEHKRNEGGVDMDPIYVTGHRNPDTDSIVAAIAYASLRNALGDREYEAACLGQIFTFFKF